MTDSTPSTSQNVKAQLGCGTLILIAIIVALFSGRDDMEEVRDEVCALRDQVTRLEAKIDSLHLALDATTIP
jgi:hypothetical protein